MGSHARRFTIYQQKIAFFRRHTHHRKGATLPLTKRFEQFKRLGRDGQHVTLLAFIAPDFLGRQAGFFEWHSAQIEAGTPARVVGEFGEGIAQAARADVVDGQDGVAATVGAFHVAGGAAAIATGGALTIPKCPAVVDDLLRTPLDLGVAALHRIKVELGCVGARSHGTGRTAAHADAHAGATQLDQQAARRELDLVGLRGVNHAQSTGDHDGLVVAALLLHLALRSGVRNALFVLAEVTQQVGPAKLVVEGRATERPFDHDLQRAGDVIGLAVGTGWQINWVLTPINF